ncbi:MAG: hypothetical protein ACOH2N_20280 [Devosia sp.]
MSHGNAALAQDWNAFWRGLKRRIEAIGRRKLRRPDWLDVRNIFPFSIHTNEIATVEFDWMPDIV